MWLSRAKAAIAAIGTVLALANCAAVGAGTNSAIVSLGASLSSEGRVYLHLEDVALQPGSGGVVRVYAGEPTRDVPVDDAHYLGYFAVVPKNSAEARTGARRMSVSLPISRSQLGRGSEVKIALFVSKGISEEVESAPVTFNRMYITDSP